MVDVLHIPKAIYMSILKADFISESSETALQQARQGIVRPRM